MNQSRIWRAFGAMMLAVASTAAVGQTPAETNSTPSAVLERAFEHRFQMDFHISTASLAEFLPPGWQANVAAQGPAKDADIRVIFIDRINVTGPDNRPLRGGSERMVYLAVPVKKMDSDVTGQMIIGGLTDNANDVPGAFGDYSLATTAKMTRSVSADNGTLTASEDWQFDAPGGEHVSLHVEYTPMPANLRAGTNETKFFDPNDPTKYQLVRTEQVTDITRNVTTAPPDRVKAYSFSAGGGKFATLFDGTEQALSWDSQRGYVLTVSAPQ